MTKSKSKKGRESEAIHVEVNNPRIHTCQGGKFVDYEIYIQTSNIAFSRKTSSIRRRYSEFIWLRNKLDTNEVNGFGSDRIVPSLPQKRLFGRFEPKFIFTRKDGLQVFLEKILSVKDFLSFSGFHLFLQSQLSLEQIEDYLNGKYKSNLSVEDIISEQELLETKSMEKTGQCNTTSCYKVVISDIDSFTFVEYVRDEDAQSFHSSINVSGESSTSSNSTGCLSDPQDCRTFIYTSYK